MAQRKESAAEAANDARDARLEARRLDGDTLEFDAADEVDIVGGVPGPNASSGGRTAGSSMVRPGSARVSPYRIVTSCSN